MLHTWILILTITQRCTDRVASEQNRLVFGWLTVSGSWAVAFITVTAAPHTATGLFHSVNYVEKNAWAPTLYTYRSSSFMQIHPMMLQDHNWCADVIVRGGLEVFKLSTQRQHSVGPEWFPFGIIALTVDRGISKRERFAPILLPI